MAINGRDIDPQARLGLFLQRARIDRGVYSTGNVVEHGQASDNRCAFEVFVAVVATGFIVLPA